jgi:hypothetical protein
MEKSRLNRENKERRGSRMVNKAGPWFDPQFDNSLKKIALQTGIVSPSQVGLELEKKKNSEKSAMELKIPPNPNNASPTKLANDSSESLPGEPQQGRPKNSKDSSTRKTKVFKPQTGANIIWANKAQDKINEYINPIMLEFYGKKNLRSLTASESKELDSLKTKLLFSLEPNTKISQEYIVNKINDINSSEINTVYSSYCNWIKSLASQLQEDLSVDDIKHAKASFYFMVYNSN